MENKTPVPPVDVDDEVYPPPKGAMAFVVLVLIGYIVYWFITWFEIFVLRGA